MRCFLRNADLAEATIRDHALEKGVGVYQIIYGMVQVLAKISYLKKKCERSVNLSKVLPLLMG